MKGALGAVVLSLAVAAPAAAADRPLVVTIEGRPISSAGTPVAFLHHGIAYASVVELVRSYGGIVTTTAGATTVTLHARTVRFVPESTSVSLDGERLKLATPAFLYGGILYVPLAFFVTRVARGHVKVDAAAATANVSVGGERAPAPTASP